MIALLYCRKKKNRLIPLVMIDLLIFILAYFNVKV